MALKRVVPGLLSSSHIWFKLSKFSYWATVESEKVKAKRLITNVGPSNRACIEPAEVLRMTKPFRNAQDDKTKPCSRRVYL
jgi:hypothetical protein